MSISYYEAYIFFNDHGYLGELSRLLCSFFGNSDYALRGFFISIHFLSLWLFYSISKSVLKQEGDAKIALIVFCLLPASGLTALLVAKSGIIEFLTLLFIYLYKRSLKPLAYMVLIFSTVLDGAFAILFLSLIFFGIFKKDNLLIATNLILFGISMTMFGFDTGGKPQGYFLDTFGIYMLIFSPLVFLYFIFALYKIPRDERPIGWYISFWALTFSLLLSFRQKIMIYDFAPFVVIAVPFMLKTFFSSYRVRIGKNKRTYNFMFALAFSSLAIIFVLSYLNRPLYIFFKDSSKHFAYNYQVAKDLANELQKEGINDCQTLDREMALRLKFYGINEGNDYLIGQKPLKNSKKVSIRYSNVEVATFYVTKINTF
ncbi:MAG: hypothetical protein PHE67_03690 [Campylobacterales bacterium]|nr:hypothetical protein [Campylobacterales bacterium]